MTIKLTRAQAVRLGKIAAEGDKGLSIGQPDQTLRILQSKGFVDVRSRTVKDHRTVAVATPAGRRFSASD